MNKIVLEKYIVSFIEGETHISVVIQEIYGGIDAFYYEHTCAKQGGDYKLLALVAALSTKWFGESMAFEILSDYQSRVI